MSDRRFGLSLTLAVSTEGVGGILLRTVVIMSMKQMHLLIRGRVQGVFFRASTQREARRLGLSGWVKNRSDGAVEVLVEGEESSLRQLCMWAERGPSTARVDDVQVRWCAYVGDYSDFRITD